MVGALVPLTLPIMEVIRHLPYLFGRELDILLLKRLSPLAKVDKQHLILAVAVSHQLAVLLHRARLAVAGQYPKGNTDVGGIEHIARENNNRLHQMVLQQSATDIQFDAVPAQCAVSKQKARHAITGQLGYDIQNPTIVGVSGRRHIVAIPARVVRQFGCSPPRFLVERRVRHDKVRLQVLMLVVVESVCRLLAQVVGDTADGEIHLRQFVGGVGVFLPIDRDVLLVAMVRLDEPHALHEHSARTATGVVDFSLVGLNHLRNKVHNGLGRVVLALAFALRDGKLAEEILIHPPDKVVLSVLKRVYLVDLVQQSGKFGTVKTQTGIVITRQCPFQ